MVLLDNEDHVFGVLDLWWEGVGRVFDYEHERSSTSHLLCNRPMEMGVNPVGTGVMMFGEVNRVVEGIAWKELEEDVVTGLIWRGVGSMPVKVGCVWVSEAVDLRVSCWLHFKVVKEFDFHCVTCV